MGLFNQKKNEEEDLEAPAPYPSKEDFKEDMKKQEIEKSLDFPRYSPIALTDTEPFTDVENMESGFNGGFEKWEDKPKSMPAAASENYQRGQSLFVKIDRYNELLDLIANIRKKLSNADGILRELEDVRAEEEKELKSWQSDLSSIKEGLVAIDEKLFEA